MFHLTEKTGMSTGCQNDCENVVKRQSRGNDLFIPTKLFYSVIQIKARICYVFNKPVDWEPI